MTIGLLGTDGVVPTGINNQGQITGVYGDAPCHRSFLRQPDGVIIQFGVPAVSPTPAPMTLAQGINSRGQITGYYLDSLTFHGFLREADGTITTFDASGSSTFPTAINARGEITGYGDHGFIRQPDGNIVAFDAPNAISTQPTAMNPRGDITGAFLDATNTYHGFLRDKNGTLTAFDVPNAINTYPTGVNPRGEITGWYSDAGGVHGFVLRPEECKWWDTKFVELGRYLCEVGAGQDWRLESLKSFDEFLEGRLPESRRKAHYLMSIHEKPSAAGAQGTEAGRMDQRKGAGKAGAIGGSAVQLCTLGAQGPDNAA